MNVFLLMVMLAQSSLALTTLAKSDACGFESANHAVVRNQAEWAALWKAHAPERPAPDVDFSKSMVLGVFLGSRPTSGYSVEILRVLAGPETKVEYAERQPDPQTMTAQILTAPCHIVAVAKQDGAVKFERVEAPPRE